MNYFELGQYAADKTPLSFIDSGLNVFIPHAIDENETSGVLYNQDHNGANATFGNSYLISFAMPASKKELARFPSFKGEPAVEQPTIENLEFVRPMVSIPKEEYDELKRLAHNGLPDDCVLEWGEVKFCPNRQGDGGMCKHCSDYNL